MTADEIFLAGNGSYGYSRYTYLITGENWWTMSPHKYYNTVAFEYYLTSSLLDNRRVNEARGVRPSVSLKLGIEIEDGDGTSNNPFIVK